uniref:Uncharacterized protein n=1 Tax=Eutreptiella gymnastica TaxID=73025 RepID=A0A7S4G0Q7_9EUGL
MEVSTGVLLCFATDRPYQGPVIGIISGHDLLTAAPPFSNSEVDADATPAVWRHPPNKAAHRSTCRSFTIVSPLGPSRPKRSTAAVASSRRWAPGIEPHQDRLEEWWCRRHTCAR